jgi:hypothetical protein
MARTRHGGAGGAGGRTPWRLLALNVALLAAGAARLPAQGHSAHPSGSWAVGARAIPVATHAAPVLYGRPATELYLTQPSLMGHLGLAGGRLRLAGTLSLEGLTLRRGELNAGIWGEGYVDRRHPHTYLHEVVATAALPARPGASPALSLTLGKGFVPFGTDDPMTRPFVKFPANHHLAQVLERLVAVAAVRVGPVALEGGVFNGDEPMGPVDFAGVRRFGDSWAARLTLLPLPGVEAQGSHARVASPEVPDGRGLDQRKWSASLRGEGRRGYALLEWARTTEYDDGVRGYALSTWLGEAALPLRSLELAARLERTTRREEERLDDPFRTPRPHYDVHWTGATRWSLLTVGVSRAAPADAGVRARPFVEAAVVGAAVDHPSSLFDPAEFYGSDRMWSVSAGVRLEAGSTHRRMGRYGAALPPHPAHAQH